MVVGAKAITSIALVAAAACLVLLTRMPDPARLVRLDAAAAFFIGALGVVAGTLAVHYWSLHRPSGVYFRLAFDDYDWGDEAHFIGGERLWIAVGENHGEAFDFSPMVQRVIYIGLALLIGLVTVDARAIDLIEKFPSRVALAASKTCPEPDEEKKDTDDPDAPGCALIRRAYELGYAKSLGPCEEEVVDEVSEICRLRQHDEPFLHYAWRLLAGAWQSVREHTSESYLAQLKQTFAERTDHLETLARSQRHLMAARPRASHHIWTTLPPLQQGMRAKVEGALEPSACVERFRRMPHQPTLGDDNALRASRSFEHVLGQLLFDPVFGQPVGYCREYTVHWGAPADACNRLIADPARFLEQSGALGEVSGVIERYQVGVELEKLRARLPAGEPDDAGPATGPLSGSPVQRFVSFHCYVDEKRSRMKRGSRAFQLAGHTFQADEIRVPEASGSHGAHIDRYAELATLLAPGFKYGSLLSHAPLDVAAGEAISEQAFAKRTYMLTKLEFLASMDIFLGDAWLLERGDLLQVYPYHVHLGNYVELFRRRYSGARGRL